MAEQETVTPKVETPAPAHTPTPSAAPKPDATLSPEEPKPEAGKTILGELPEGKPGEAKPDANQAAPEVYKDFTLPDGITVDTKLLDSFKGLAKELNLSQEAAQKFVTLQGESVKAASEALVKEAEIQKVKMLEEFKQATIKYLGVDYQKELSFAAKALNRFGSPELRKMLDETGFGNHPQMVKAFIAIGKTMAEDVAPGPAGTQPAGGEQEQMRRMFPSMYNEDGTPKK